MNMPGMAAEASVYKTTNHYTSGRDFSNNLYTTVTPQDCGVIDTIVCGGAIVVGSTLCAGICLDPRAGPRGCVACWTAALDIVGFVTCRDCIPAWMRAIIDAFDGGPGGQPSCCPPGTTCSCGGHCVGNLLCTGTCLSPGQACPGPPPPPPIGCGVGQKCCERDDQGNCIDCIPVNQRCPQPSIM